MRNLAAFVFLFTVLISCQKDEPVSQDIPLLTFTQDAGSVTSSSDDWIFITDESGNILDTRHFEAGETIVLKNSKITSSQKINVTIFHYLQPSTETIDFDSYLDITPNQTWIYKKSAVASPTKIGTATINVSNAPAFPLGITVTNNRTSSSTRISSPASVTINLFKFPDRLFASGFRRNSPLDVGTPFYFEVNNVLDGVTITADYTNDFKPLQNMYTTLEGGDPFSVNVYGISNVSGVDPMDIQGYLNYSGSSANWGYNNGFDLYRTSASKSLGKLTRQYFKLGAPVASFLFPNHTFSVSSGSLNDFAFSISGDYQLRDSRWTVAVPEYQSILSWRIYSSPAGKQKFLKIPDEIKNLYPSLAIESLLLKDNTFTAYIDGFSYNDFINAQMSISSSKKPYSSEYQTIIIQN